MNNLRVLIAGTSSSYLEISKKILKFHYNDCQIDFAHSGSQCIEYALNRDYDVALFDYDLGDRNCLDVIDTLKTRVAKTLLIPMIEEGDENKAIQCMEQGASDYIVKVRGYLTALPFALRNILERRNLVKVDTPRLSLADQSDIQEGYFILDRKGRILSANQNLAKITSYSSEELLELMFTDLLPKDKERSFYNWLNIVDHNGNSNRPFHTEILGKKGNKVSLDIVLTAVKDENKNIVSYRGKVELIEGETKKFEEEQGRVDQTEMINQISQAITTSYDEPLNALLERLAEIACQVFRFQRSTIALLDKRKKTYVKQAMIGFPALRQLDNGNAEVPQEVVDKIFLDRFRVKAIYYKQAHRQSASYLSSRTPERRTQKRRPQNKWHRRDLILVNLTVKNGDSFGYISLDTPISNSQPDRNTFHNLELFGRLASMAIENYYQFSALEKRSRRLKQILVTSNIFKLYLSLNDLLNEVVWSIKFSLDFNLVALGLVSKKSGSLQIKAVACDDKIKRRQINELDFPLQPLSDLFRSEYNNGKSYLVLKAERVLDSFKRIYNGAEFDALQNGNWPSRAVLLVPIKSKEDKIIGVLMVDDPVNKKLPSMDVMRTLEILANQVAVAIDNRIMYVQAKRRIQELDQNGQSENELNSSGLKGFVDKIFR